MANTKKKSAREKRVLVASLLVAAVMIGGSTFAWFTSKDEVTNRLTASADYGVSIVEDFTPPEEWLPGQKINKDVSAVNTGNVDAYVRLAILNDLKLNVKGAGVAVDANATTMPALPASEKAFVELNFTPANGSAQTDDTNASLKKPNEVSTIQAGGTLVWTPDGAVKPTDAQNVSAGDDVTNNAADYEEADQFTPDKTGLYLFRRTVYEGDNSKTVKYSGYFYNSTTKKYYALETEPGTIYATGEITTYVEGETGAPENPTEILKSVSGIKLATTKEDTVQNIDTTKVIGINWYSSAMDAETATATTAGANDAKWIQLTYEAVSGNPVKLNIELASDWATNWTYVQTNNAPKVDNKNDFGYFYYNNIIKAGYTTPKLIESVTLDSTVTQDAYNDLVYDLTVALDSVQIAKSEDQKQYTNDTIKTWIGAATVDPATGKPSWK